VASKLVAIEPKPLFLRVIKIFRPANTRELAATALLFQCFYVEQIGGKWIRIRCDTKVFANTCELTVR
jgi:hypothetical protein